MRRGNLCSSQETCPTGRFASPLRRHHSPASPLDLRQYRLCLGQPEGHVHRPVQVDGGAQCRTSLLLLAGHGIHCPEATAAVRLEWAHTEFFGQGEGLVVGGHGGLDLWKGTVRGNLTEEP